MGDRSIVARLRLDISDLRANARAGKAELAGIAASAKDVGARGGAALTGLGKGLDAGLAKVSKHEQTLNRVGAASTKVGLVAAAAFGIAVKSAADFDQGMSNVAATGDDARKNIGALRAEALRLGADTKFSATESAEGIENLLKAGVSAQDTLGGGLKGALDLAAAGQISVADASETAATALTQFKLQGKDVPHIADLLAAAAGKAQGEVGDMAMALKQSGLVASQFGLSIEDTSGTLAAFASAGLIGSDAGTSFKTMLLALSNPAEKTRNLMDDLGISAYDAQGKFVGITALAEQLKTRLSGLSEEQRNSALAQIFGNDAIRAANVLYSEGADGIQKWIGQVNDQGYAAETAATKMDNLKGDLEQLKGALETALIGGGSGSTAALRDITKYVTSLVNGFNELDPATQGAVVKVLALVAVLGLGGGAVLKLVTSLAAGRAALVELGVAARVQAAGGLGAITPAAAGAAAALAAVAIGAKLVADAGQQMGSQGEIKGQLITLATSGDRASASVKNLNAAFGQTNGFDRFGSVVSGGLVAPVDNLSDALKVVSSQQGSLNWIQGLREKVLPGQQAFEKAAAGVKAVDTELAGLAGNGHLDQAQAAFAKIARDSGLPMDQLVQQFGDYHELLVQQATDLGVTSLSVEDYGKWMQGTVPMAIALKRGQLELTQAVKDSGPAIESTRAALEQLNQPLRLSADESANLSKQLFAQGDAFQNGITAHASFREAVDAASETMSKNGDYLTKNGKALSDNTSKGRENIAALGQLASAGKDYVRTLVEQGASSKEARDATSKVRDEFVKAADAADLSSGAAKRLADDYGLIPEEVSTEFDAFGIALQQQKVADYQNALAQLPDEVKARIEAIYNREGPKAAIEELDRLSGKTSTPRILTKSDARKVSEDAQRVLDAIHDVDPKVKTKKDTSAAEAARRFLNSIKDVDPKVLTKKDLSAAQAAAAYLRGLDGRTATMTVTTRRITEIITKGREAYGNGVTVNADGGPISLPRFADGGGPIVGNGGSREDNIAGIDRETGIQTSWVSNREFVTNAASYSKSKDAVETINADPSRRYIAVPVALANGGAVASVRAFAKGGSVDVASTILALIRALSNPLADIAKARADVSRENAAIRKPKAKLDAAERRYDRNVERRQDLREEVAQLKKKADATKGVTKADREYKKAQAELRDANNAVTRSSSDKRKAQEAYDKVAGKSKEATDRLKQAQEQLAEAARSVSDAFRDSYISKTSDARDLLTMMQDGAKDLTAFAGQVKQLRSKKLSESVLQQVIDLQKQNPQAGADLAAQILSGGSSLISQLNAANTALQQAADNLGYLAATGVQRHAGGGLVYGPGTGTSDDVILRGSAGEFMQQQAAVKHYGLQFMQDVNRMRYQPGAVQAAPQIDMEALRAIVGGPRVNVEKMYGGDPYATAKALDQRSRDAQAASGMSIAP